MNLANDKLLITEERYHEIIESHKKGEIVLYIDVSSFRELFTQNNSKEIKQSTQVSIKSASIVVSFLFYLIPICIAMLSILSVVAYKWWAFLVLPLFLFIWFIVHSKASIGKQSILGFSILFAVLISIVIVLVNSLGILISSSLLLFLFLVFISKLLYYLTSKFAFNLLLNNYKFFAVLYEKKYNSKSIYSMVWIDTKENYSKTEKIKKTINSGGKKEVSNTNNDQKTDNNKYFSIKNIISVAKESLPSCSGLEFVNKCEHVFNFELKKDIQNPPDSSPIPFDNTITLTFLTKVGKDGIMTIFETNHRISEIEIQILNSEQKDFNDGVELFNKYFGSPMPSPWNNQHALHFQNPKTSGYISIIKVASIDVLTIRFGNNKIWNNYFNT